MKDFFQLVRNLKKDFSGLKPVSIALLGDSATQFLAQALRAEGFDRGYNALLWEADFDQIEQQIFAPDSGLYAFQPDIVIIFKASHKLLNRYNKLTPGQYSTLADVELDSIKNLYNTLVSRTPAKVLFYNYNNINDAVFGSFALKTEASFSFQLSKLNFNLMSWAALQAGFFIIDLGAVQNNHGKHTFFQSPVYINSDMVLSVDILPETAARTFDMIDALYGKIKKCIVLDLDNTLWGGVIGDDGIENIQIGQLGIGKAFTEFQYWLKKLKNRGIILAVCSKNDDAIAREVFDKHPDMVLKADDFAVFVANWENKAENIRYIQRTLNIGFDAMVFIDDSAFERNMVREFIPDICVPEMPEDPAGYLQYLYSLNLFETVTFSEEDTLRTGHYQMDALRTTAQSQFTNEDDYLASLKMQSVVSFFNAFNIPRVAQLSQRSNQFNLRTVRYAEADIKRMAEAPEYHPFAFTLEDKFGDNGLIAVVILKEESPDTLFIDTWFMSCRVLKRSMENFTLNTIAGYASGRGYLYIKGEYIPTAKNDMVRDHYKNLGFVNENNYWMLNLEQYCNRKCHILIKNTDGEK